MKSIHITEAELPIMKLIWQKGEITSSEILSEVGGNKSTVKTLLSRLVKKGAVNTRECGRGFCYTAAIGEESYIKAESRSFLNNFFEGSAKKLLLNFINEEQISAKELEELLGELEERKQQ